MIEGTAIVEITYISLNIEDPEFDFVAGSAYSPAQLDNFATIILKQHTQHYKIIIIILQFIQIIFKILLE